MSSRSLILESDWLVFIDGVQVPHQGIRMQSSRNNLSSCTVTLEPDSLLTEYLRPQSVVSVWARERFPDKPGRNEKVLADAQSQYYLYWEGLLAGHVHSKSPTTRAMTIQCESIFMPWTRTKAFMFGVGAYPQSIVLSGSRKIRFGGQGSIFSFAILGNKFSNLEDTPFAKRIQDTVAFLSSSNGVLRLQTDRYSLLDRINSMNDTVYEDLLAGKALNLIGDGMSDFPDDASVLAVINHLQQYGFYSHYEIFAPVKNEGQYPTKRESSFGVEERHRFDQKYQLNQLLFLPELYFAPPPPCNFIFPDHIRSMSVGRNFYLEPTRALVPDPIMALSGFAYHLAPASILRGADTDKMTAREVFGMASSAINIEEGGSATSPYEQDVEGGTINLFETILDSEIEKGIVAKVDSYRFETLAAFANAQGAREGKNTDAENVDPNSYSQLISSVVNYRFRLDQYTRQVTLDLMGHRDIVPGFSCAIFDEDVSYVGFVDSVDVSVDPLGTETTSVTLSKARQLSTPPLALLDRFAPAVERLDQIRREKIAEVTKDAIQAAVTRNTLSGLIEQIGEALSDEDPFINSLYQQAIAAVQQEYDFEVDGLLDDLSGELNVPLPPGFLNRDLLSPKKVDDAYERLLGCSRFYTSNYAYEVSVLPVSPEIIENEVKSVLDSDQIRNTQLEGMRMQAESMYALARVFRLDGKAVDDETQDTWQEVRDRSDSLGQTSYEWATRNFTKRKRYRLGDYCATNGLRLTVNTSNGPNPTPFLMMTPAAVIGAWDNTLFSKLVMAGDPSVVANRDPVIEELQRNAPSYLGTGIRQFVISQYSKRHFGARAFDGS